MKFGSLIKKELGGLLTPQALMSMLFTCVLLIVMGQVLGGAMEEGMDTSDINICDMDKSDYSVDMLANLEKYGSKPVMYDIQGEDYAAELERLDLKSLVIIPEGFGKSVVNDKKPAELRVVTKLSTGMTSMMSSVSVSDTVSAIEASVSDYALLKQYGLTEEEAARIKEPTATVEYTAFNGKTAQIPSTMLMSVMMTQSLIVPIAVFFMLLMASQMIISAISTEKIDKTLETLLSAPVPRITILTAKMTAAFIVALINAAVMIIGFMGYISGMMGGVSNEIGAAAPNAAGGALTAVQGMAALGLNLGAGDILLVGLQMFLSIAIGLSIALMLGALCEDAQSLNTLLMPMMILVMVPFFVTMFTDISTMSPVLKTIMYIIPFTHSYTAVSSLMQGNMPAFWGGFAYQIVFLAVCMFMAVRMFTTDKIFTMTGAIQNKMKNKGVNQAAK